MDNYLPAMVRRLQTIVVSALCGVALLALAWLMWQTGNQFLESGETTAQLKILKAPFLYGMAVLCGVTGLVHLAQIAQPPQAQEEGEGAAL